jgi:hypothetical protein
MQYEFDLVHIFRRVDDNLFVRRKGAATNMEDIITRSTELGVKTNAKKYSNFSPQQKFIGFVWDGEKKTVGLPPGRAEGRLERIRAFLVPRATFSFKKAMVIAG